MLLIKLSYCIFLEKYTFCTLKLLTFCTLHSRLSKLTHPTLHSRLSKLIHPTLQLLKTSFLHPQWIWQLNRWKIGKGTILMDISLWRQWSVNFLLLEDVMHDFDNLGYKGRILIIWSTKVYLSSCFWFHAKVLATLFPPIFVYIISLRLQTYFYINSTPNTSPSITKHWILS